MTTLCIDELSGSLKRRWGWAASATHVPADVDCPLLSLSSTRRPSQANCPDRAVLPRWLCPKREFDGPPGIARLHGKASPSMG